MPTARPRHVVTETDELAAALDAAARRFPGLSRSQLVVRLALEADQAAAATDQERHRRRMEAVERAGGALTGSFGEGYLAELREDWPA